MQDVLHNWPICQPPISLTYWSRSSSTSVGESSKATYCPWRGEGSFVLRRGMLSRPEPCSVDFGRETPKFWFEFCCGFLCVFLQEKDTKNSEKKIPHKIHPEIDSHKCPSDFCRSLSLEVMSGSNQGDELCTEHLWVSSIWRTVWESLALLQGSFGPFGPKVANRVRKWVPGPSRPRGPKSPKRSRKRVKIVEK